MFQSKGTARVLSPWIFSAETPREISARGPRHGESLRLAGAVQLPREPAGPRSAQGIIYTIQGIRCWNYTPNLPTNIVDFTGFDSNTILILRGGILMSIGDFPEILSQAMLVGIMLVGRLGVVETILGTCFVYDLLNYYLIKCGRKVAPLRYTQNPTAVRHTDALFQVGPRGSVWRHRRRARYASRSGQRANGAVG